MAKKSGAKILFGFLFFIILVGGLAGGGAWYLTENRAEGYQASATLLLDGPENGFGPPPLRPHPDGPDGEHRPPPPGGGIRGHVGAALGFPSPHSRQGITPPDYASLFSTDHMAATLRDLLVASGTQGMTLEAVRKSMSVETQVALQTRDNVVYRRLVTLRFTAASPELAATAANAWAESARSFVEELESKEQAERAKELQQKLDVLGAELSEAKELQEALGVGPGIAFLAADAKSRDESATEHRLSLEVLNQRVAHDEAALATLKSYVSKAPVAVVLELSVREAEKESAVAGTIAERDHLTSRADTVDAERHNAQIRWADARRQDEASKRVIKRVGPQVDALKRDLSAASEHRPGLRIAAPAVAPETPIGPHRYVIVAGAALLGAILGMIVYFALLTLRVYARELDRA